MSMSNHFDYLLDVPAGDFFQKLVCEEADRDLPPSPPTMQKQASAAPRSDFEKIASNLDRNIEILRAGGPYGLSLGMNKRADAYFDLLLANASLTEEQFGEIFDKVAAAAIETDLNMAFLELCDDYPEEAHPWIEQELIKVGYQMVKDAMAEKEAAFPRLRAMFSGGKAMGAKGLVGAGGKAMGRGYSAISREVSREGRALAESAKNVAGRARAGASEFRAGRRVARGEKDLAAIEKGLSSRFARGQGEGAKAYRRSLQRQRYAIQKGMAENPNLMRAQARRVQEGKSRMQVTPQGGGPAANVLRGGKGGGGAIQMPKATRAPAGAAPANTTAAHAPAPAAQTQAMAQTRQIRAEGSRERAATEAAQAAEAPGTRQTTNIRGQGRSTGPAPTPGGQPQGGQPRGTGSQPATGGEPAPVSPAQAEQAGAPKGVIDKLKTEGWDSLTAGEKFQVGAGGVLGAKMLFDND